MYLCYSDKTLWQNLPMSLLRNQFTVTGCVAAEGNVADAVIRRHQRLQISLNQWYLLLNHNFLKCFIFLYLNFCKLDIYSKRINYKVDNVSLLRICTSPRAAARVNWACSGLNTSCLWTSGHILQLIHAGKLRIPKDSHVIPGLLLWPCSFFVCRFYVTTTGHWIQGSFITDSSKSQQWLANRDQIILSQPLTSNMWVNHPFIALCAPFNLLQLASGCFDCACNQRSKALWSLCFRETVHQTG